LPYLQEGGDDRPDRAGNRWLIKARPKVFGRAHGVYFRRADLPLRKGGYFSHVLIEVTCVLRFLLKSSTTAVLAAIRPDSMTFAPDSSE
jgi:hypothetical protein